MAIVSCPQCGERTSSVAKKCRNCDFELQTGDAENAARVARRARRVLARRLAGQAALATLVGIGGGLWLMFGAGPRAGGWPRTVAALLFVGGLGWYGWVRFQLWKLRRN